MILPLKIDDQALYDAVDFLDEQSDLFLSSIGERAITKNLAAENIAKAIKENAVDITLKGFSPQTQDVMNHLLDNESVLSTMANYIEKRNVFEYEGKVLELAHRFGSTMERISTIKIPPADLKEPSIALQLDNQQAKIKELLSFLNYKSPELKEKVEVNLDLGRIQDVKKHIMNIDISDQMKASITSGCRARMR